MSDLSHQVNRRRLSLLALGGLLLGACSHTPERAFVAPVYPPPPAEARFVFDTDLRSASDVEEKSFGDTLREVATGLSSTPAGLGKPYDIAATRGRVYVSDTQQRAIVLFDLQGKRMRLLGTQGPGTLRKPLGLAVSGDELYVADITARRVVVFDLEGNFRRAIGNDKIFRRPTDVALSPAGDRLYVVEAGGIESEHHHLLMFDPRSGELLKRIGQRGTSAGEFNLPLHAAVAPNGDVYVVDGGNFRVQILEPDGRPKNSFGSIGRRSGQFSRPKGIAIDPRGNVHVVDTAFGNFQIFDEAGKLLLFIGERGTGDRAGRFMLPSGICSDEMGRIYVVDQFFRKVEVYRPLDVPGLREPRS